MKAAPPRLPRKPEARTETIEDLVTRVLLAQVRVPKFQRGLKWKSQHVVELFDSLYRGYPIGSLLFYKRRAPAGRLQVGPLDIAAEELSEAWWVVDGQQRITSLAACLARPLPWSTRPKGKDPYRVYFDPTEQVFRPPSADGSEPTTWVPLPQLRDTTQLSEWIFGWKHGQDTELRRIVFEAGARLREYTVPLYLVETDDEEVAKTIFYRVNTSGKRLEWKEVHEALFGASEEQPSTLAELATDLEAVGMGQIEPDRLLNGLLALRGEDPTENLSEHIQRDTKVLGGAVHEALPVFRRALSFLRHDAAVPHLRLFPKSILLDVLIRFFALHPEPNPRSRLLMSRWLWRAVMGAGTVSDQTLRRRGVAAISENEEESVQELLALVRRKPQRAFDLPQDFDPRADASRIVLLALFHSRPRDLLTGSPIDVVSLIERDDRDCFVKIDPRFEGTGAASPANRIVAPKRTPIGRLLRHRIDESGTEHAILASHLISSEAAQRWQVGDFEGFLAVRSKSLAFAAREFLERMAAWEHNDRPSITHILASVGLEL